MKSFHCRCGFVFIITKGFVYGPIVDNQIYLARIISKEDWKSEYGDCHNYYKKGKK